MAHRLLVVGERGHGLGLDGADVPQPHSLVVRPCDHLQQTPRMPETHKKIPLCPASD